MVIEIYFYEVYECKSTFMYCMETTLTLLLNIKISILIPGVHTGVFLKNALRLPFFKKNRGCFLLKKEANVHF